MVRDEQWDNTRQKGHAIEGNKRISHTRLATDGIFLQLQHEFPFSNFRELDLPDWSEFDLRSAFRVVKAVEDFGEFRLSRAVSKP